VTLIAGFRCYEGAVICADSQETVGDGFRVKVDKLEPQSVGDYELAAGGSGNVAALIDGFVLNLAYGVKGWPSGLTEDEIRGKVREVLLDFYANEVKLCPEPDDDKHLEFIICLRDQKTRVVHLIETADSVAKPVRASSVVGYYPSLYQHEIDRVYRPKQAASQVVLLALHVMSVAKKMSNMIGDDTKLIVATEHGMKDEPRDVVIELERRLDESQKLIATLVTTIPNLGLNDAGIVELLAVFEDQVLQMRERYREAGMLSLAARVYTDPSQAGVAYPHFAEGSRAAITAKELHAEIERLRRVRRSAIQSFNGSQEP
jgi:hypothetical protein